MKMTITKDFFEKIITSAANAQCDVWDKMENYISSAQNYIIFRLFGNYNIETLDEKIKNELQKYICLFAFVDAIPDLDLILTSNGFGVVSNQNLAPASKDRVQALYNQVDRRKWDSYEALIEMLRGNAEWYTSRGKLNILSVFYSSTLLKLYSGYPDANYHDLLSVRPKISDAEVNIHKAISYKQYKVFIDDIAIKSDNSHHEFVIMMLQQFIGLYIVGSEAVADVMDSIIDYMENNIGEFSEYAQSDAYKARHFETYQNQKDDSTFFFG